MREEIIAIIDQIESETILRLIYKFAKAGLKVCKEDKEYE